MKKTTALLALLAVGVAHAQVRDASFLSTNINAPIGPSAPLSCGGFDAYQQPLDDTNFSTARTADAEFDFTSHESMVDGAGTITPMIDATSDGIKIWGISAEFNAGFVAACAEDDLAGTPFNLTFSEDNGGEPGNVIASVTGTVDSIVDTGIPFAFTSVQEVNLSFPETDMSNVSWISVQRQAGENAANGNSCLFLWVNETTASYDDFSQQDDGAAFAPETYDLTMCVKEFVPPQIVPALRWYGILALLLLMVFFIRKPLIRLRN